MHASVQSWLLYDPHLLVWCCAASHRALLSMLQAVKDQRGNTWHVTATNRRGVITVDGLSKSFGSKACLGSSARQMDPL